MSPADENRSFELCRANCLKKKINQKKRNEKKTEENAKNYRGTLFGEHELDFRILICQRDSIRRPVSGRSLIARLELSMSTFVEWNSTANTSLHMDRCWERHFMCQQAADKTWMLWQVRSSKPQCPNIWLRVLWRPHGLAVERNPNTFQSNRNIASVCLTLITSRGRFVSIIACIYRR